MLQRDPYAISAELSVAAAFSGAQVLITGATGYVGSLVLEQLLRVCSDVSRVLVLVRPKQGRSPVERLRRLLGSGLFHQLWRQPDVLEKVGTLRCILNAATSSIKGKFKVPALDLCSLQRSIRDACRIWVSKFIFFHWRDRSRRSRVTCCSSTAASAALTRHGYKVSAS